jgi:DNA-binding CsgD family transcriptional regulator
VEALRQARDLATIWVGLGTLEAAADWLGAAAQHEQAVTLWASIDSTRARTLDRTPGNDLGIFERSRDRDLRALTAGAWQAATAAGKAMTLDQALAFAIDELVAADAVQPAVRPGHARRHGLTSREREVLELVAAGRSDGQIGEALFISKSTAAVHVANIKGKLGATSRVEIATTAIEQGLVAPPAA